MKQIVKTVKIHDEIFETHSTADTAGKRGEMKLVLIPFFFLILGSFKFHDNAEIVANFVVRSTVY